jgi:hypothetical protein
MTALDVIANAVARVVAVEEALEFGDTGEAFAILVDLEADLVGSLAALSMEAA